MTILVKQYRQDKLHKIHHNNRSRHSNRQMFKVGNPIFHKMVGKGNHRHNFKNRKIIKPSKILLIKRQRQKQRQKRNNKK